MTRKELLEKRRVGFEEWVKDNWDNSDIRLLRDPDDRDYYKFVPTHRAWGTWNAALDSVEIELPSAFEDEYGHLVLDKDDAIDSIEQQGYKVKP